MYTNKSKLFTIPIIFLTKRSICFHCYKEKKKVIVSSSCSCIKYQLSNIMGNTLLYRNTQISNAQISIWILIKSYRMCVVNKATILNVCGKTHQKTAAPPSWSDTPLSWHWCWLPRAAVVMWPVVIVRREAGRPHDDASFFIIICIIIWIFIGGISSASSSWTAWE